MASWEQFEEDCANYLQRVYGRFANFKRVGGSDSTIPDIRVTTSKGTFYIEVKESQAQCGQFVLLPDLNTRTFTYSPLNKTPINKYSSMIMEHMNAAFDEYREAGTAGRAIVMPNDQEIFSGWIISAYREKGALFVITDNYVLIPIEQFKDFFNISATYRIKRSGSASVGKSRIDRVANTIRNFDFVITDITAEDDKLFISSPVNCHDMRFLLDGTEYMLSRRGAEYEVRRLSNTYNANVIFSIEFRSGMPGIADQDFIAFLQ